MSGDDDILIRAPRRIIHVLLSYDDLTDEQKHHLRNLSHKAEHGPLDPDDVEYIVAIVRLMLTDS